MLNNDKERIVIEIGTGWTKVLVGSSLGTKKKKGLVNENIKVKDTFLIKTPINFDSDSDSIANVGKQFIPFFNVKELIEQIREKLKERKIKAEKVIVTISDRSVLSREMVLPKVEEEKLKEIIGFELQELLSIEPRMYLIDFKVIEEVKVEEAMKYKLIVGALPREEGHFYHGLIRDLGREPYALDITSNTIAKLFDRNMKINGKLREIESRTFAYVDIGYSSIRVHIIDKGILRFTRNIEGGMEPISVADGAKIIETAESVELVKKWIGSLEQMFKFYTSREANREIDEVFILGGGAQIPNIEQYFSEIMGVSAETIKEIENLDFHRDCAYFSLPLFLNSVASLIRK